MIINSPNLWILIYPIPIIVIDGAKHVNISAVQSIEFDLINMLISKMNCFIEMQ